MSENPFIAPVTARAEATRTPRQFAFIRRRKAQLGIGIMVQYLLIFGLFVLTINSMKHAPIEESQSLDNLEISLVVISIAEAIALPATALIGLSLALRLYHPVMALFLAAVSIVPILNLPALLLIEWRAKSYLRETNSDRERPPVIPN